MTNGAGMPVDGSHGSVWLPFGVVPHLCCAASTPVGIAVLASCVLFVHDCRLGLTLSVLLHEGEISSVGLTVWDFMLWTPSVVDFEAVVLNGDKHVAIVAAALGDAADMFPDGGLKAG
jgi:hypothetical protein